MNRGMRLTALLTLVLVALVAFYSTRPASDPGFRAEAGTPVDQPVFADDSIVVRAVDTSALGDVEAFAANHGYTVSQRDDDLMAVSVALPEGTGVIAAIGEFMSAPGVLFAEPTFQFYRADTPADPLFGRQNTYLSKVKAPQAWDIEKGRPEVIVAVLDTGIDVSHPDLAGRVWTNPGEIANNALDDDGNGCVDDLNGCGFISEPTSGCTKATSGYVNDEVGHGTFVAGIIAANGDSQGIVGVARNVTVMPVRVLDCNGVGTSMAVAKGILYAAKNGAKILNVSLGGSIDSQTLRDAVRQATDDYGVLIVAASGNSSKAGVAYPARYEKVLAVGAASISNPDKVATFSTSGPEVDVVAIGENIIGTVPKSSCTTFLPCISGQPYASGSGTSFSAPQVSGLAALILSRRPGTAAAVVHKLIKDTAVEVPEGKRADWAGAGRIDMAEALAPQFRLGVPGVTKN